VFTGRHWIEWPFHRLVVCDLSIREFCKGVADKPPEKLLGQIDLLENDEDAFNRTRPVFRVLTRFPRRFPPSRDRRHLPQSE
jgi:hypothetical protein